MKRIFIVAVLAAIVAAAFYGNRYFDRFITDREYKSQILAEFEKRVGIYNLSGQINEAIEGADLQNKEVEALKWLYASMPWSDAADYPVDFYIENIRYAFKAKDQMPWGKSVPEREFRHFVLPVRVNNEKLDNFREVYYHELSQRLKGLGMEQAALEVNHWCHETATYQPSDSRTSSPLATILTATGRCGEESVLLVAALRCVGIPARQVYTPRWAHTDDNHAWVEAWIDGKWYFMGACEPEPVLNMAWFNEPAARAMLMHTKVFGNYVTDEDVISRTNCFTEINMIQNYVDTRRAVVKVVDTENSPVEGADVEFKIYNYAEFYSVTSQKSNSRGEAALTTGLGDLLAWASHGRKFGFAKICSDTTVVVLNHNVGEEFTVQFEVNPPAEGNIPIEVTDEQISRNKARLAYEDSVRMAYTSTFYKGASDDAANADSRICQLLEEAKGNWQQVQSFISGVDRQRIDEAIAMLQSVSKKDSRDTPAEIFSAHLLNTPENSDGKTRSDLYAQYLLNPRIAGENLSAYRDELRCAGFPVEEISKDPVLAVKLFEERFSAPLVDEYNPQRLATSPVGVLESGCADRLSRKIFVIALLRSCGVPARIDQVTGKPQYYKDGWFDIVFSDEVPSAGEGSAGAVKAELGTLRASYNPTRYLSDPQYYVHFTISKIDGGVASLLNFEEGDATELGSLATWNNILRKGFEVEKGYYLITSGTRTSSGGALVNMVFKNVEPDKISDFELVLPQNEDKVSVVGYIDAEKKFLPEGAQTEASLLSATGRGFFVAAVLGSSDEPSNHALRELEASSQLLKDFGRKVVVLTPDTNSLVHLDKSKLQGLGDLAVYGTDVDGKVAQMLSGACNGENKKLPVIVVADSFGRVVYFSQGYNTSIRTQMTDVISKIRN